MVGGGAARSGEILLEPARAEVAGRALPPIRDKLLIVHAALGEDAGLVGAGILALERGDV